MISCCQPLQAFVRWCNLWRGMQTIARYCKRSQTNGTAQAEVSHYQLSHDTDNSCKLCQGSASYWATASYSELLQSTARCCKLLPVIASYCKPCEASRTIASCCKPSRYCKPCRVIASHCEPVPNKWQPSASYRKMFQTIAQCHRVMQVITSCCELVAS